MITPTGVNALTVGARGDATIAGGQGGHKGRPYKAAPAATLKLFGASPRCHLSHIVV